MMGNAVWYIPIMREEINIANINVPEIRIILEISYAKRRSM